MTMFSFRSRTTPKLISLLVLAMLIGWTSLALAVKPDPSAPGGHLLIKEVDVAVAVSETTFTITGQDFDFVNLSDLVVTLGEFGALTIVTAAPSEIVATFSAAIDPGDYLLSVSTGNGQSKHDEYDLTIGAQVIARFSQQLVSSGGTAEPIAQCLPGETVVGGGFDTPVNDDVVVSRSRPLVSGEPVPSINSSPMKNLSFLDTGRRDEFFDHTGKHGIAAI